MESIKIRECKDLPKVLEGHKWMAEKVVIIYYPSCAVPSTYPFVANLRVDGEKTQVIISSISVGFEGPGPREVAKALDFLGIEYTRDDIFSDTQRDDSGSICLEYPQATS